jgi:hypothetical protein
LKGVLAKVLYETNMQEEMGKEEKEDLSYFEQQILNPVIEDAVIEGEGEEFYEYEVPEDSYVVASDEEVEKRRHPAGFGFTDEDVNADSDEDTENKETVQAHTYPTNTAFVL